MTGPKRDCPACDGTGYIEIEEDDGDMVEEDCPDCDGRGYEEDDTP